MSPGTGPPLEVDTRLEIDTGPANRLGVGRFSVEFEGGHMLMLIRVSQLPLWRNSPMAGAALLSFLRSARAEVIGPNFVFVRGKVPSAAQGPTFSPPP